MRLAVVHKRFGLDGGTERFLESFARRMGERGHEVHVYCASVDPRFARTRVARFRRLLGGGPLAGIRALLLWFSAAVLVRAARYDVVVHLDRTGTRDVYRAGGGCHRTWFRLSLSRAASTLDRLRLRLSVRHALALLHERRALLRSRRFVVPSDRARRDLLDAYGPLAERVEVLPNGVDLDRFHPKGRSLFFEEVRSGMGLRPEELVLLFVGSDFWRKGLDTLLRAVAKLGESAADLRVLVVGADPRRRRYEFQAAELGLRDRVTFLGMHDAPEKLYAAADLLVLPTRHDPFANVTLEALGAGLPVITSRSNGATEVLPDGAGLAVLPDAEDDAALAECIRSMLEPARIQERRAAARSAAEACSETAAVDRWESLLRGTAAERGARG
jgi:UDP-glucose:(heptosyl)LPS alpha-1,3-glucosyltransferase